MALALEYKNFCFAHAAADDGAAGAESAAADDGATGVEGTAASGKPTSGGASPTAAPVLSSVNWAVRQGEFAVLVGATGSGKTTLMRCAVPALRPAGARSGSVLLSGTSIDQLSPAQAAAAVGYVAQNPDAQIVCDTVWHQLAFGLENLGVPQQEMRRIVAELSHFLGIAGWFRKRTSELSGGQRQLLNLASVLVMKPRVLLLDEPVSMLDPVAQKDFMHTLQRLNTELGLTVVVSTHSPLGFVPYATRFFELKDGAVLPATRDDVIAGRVGLGSLGGLEQENAAKDSGLAHAVSNARNASPTPAAAITLRDVYLRYSKGADFVLRGMDLDVRCGSIHAVIGGNGCGKSTLLRAIAGLMKPERGKLKNALSTRQALLPQDPKALFVRDSVLEELQEWQRVCGYGDAAVCGALQRCGLDGRADLHPYDLSGGQQQLLALAKLTLTDPDLLLLDEPTKGLDPAARMHVARELQRLRDEGRTVVLVTHDLAFASAVADEVSLLFDGQMACTQQASEFFEGSIFYRPDHDAFLIAWEREHAGTDDSSGKRVSGCEGGDECGGKPTSASGKCGSGCEGGDERRFSDTTATPNTQQEESSR